MQGSLRDRGLVLRHQVGAAIARSVPAPVGTPVARGAGWCAAFLSPGRHPVVARNLARAAGRPPELGVPPSMVRAAFASYAAYWYDLLRMPRVSDAEVDRTFRIQGWEHAEAAIAGGRGAVFALPHLGSWEIGARWAIARTGRPLAAVVEQLDARLLFSWFADQREAMGIDAIPMGEGAFPAVIGALRDGAIVCLLADRDLSGDGCEVDFLGERTTLPAGPALAAMRAKVELLPVCVYALADGSYLGVVRPPVDTSRRGPLRVDVARITQDLADELGSLVRSAPEQWHCFQPNWPSDRHAGPEVARERGIA